MIRQCECMAFEHDAHRGFSQLESPEFIHMTPSAPASVSAARAKPRRGGALQPEGLMPWTQKGHLECMTFSHDAQRELNQLDSPGFIQMGLSALPVGLQPMQSLGPKKRNLIGRRPGAIGPAGPV